MAPTKKIQGAKATQQLRKAYAQQCVTNIENTVEFISSHRDYFICVFKDAERCKQVRDELFTQNFPIGDAPKNRNKSFRFNIRRLEVPVGFSLLVSDSRSQVYQKSSFEKTAAPEIEPSAPVKEAEVSRNFRSMGLGIKNNEGNLEFYNDAHKVMYEKISKMSEKRTSFSADILRRKFQSLLYDANDQASLVEDVVFAKFMLEAHGFNFTAIPDLVTNDKNNERKHKEEPRTTPFIFLKKLDAEEAFKFTQGIGLNPEWQPKTHLNFWLLQRKVVADLGKVKRIKAMHPVTKALVDGGFVSHNGPNTDGRPCFYVNKINALGGTIILSGGTREEKVKEANNMVAYLTSINFTAKIDGKTKVNASKHTSEAKIESKSVKRKSENLHPISAMAEKFKLSGKVRNGNAPFGYLNSIGYSNIKIVGGATKNRKIKKAEKLYEFLTAGMPEWDFTYKPGSLSIKWKLREENNGNTVGNQKNSSVKSRIDTTRRPFRSNEDQLTSMFTEEIWLHILREAPAAMMEKAWPGIFEPKEDSKEKKIVEAIRKGGYKIIDKKTSLAMNPTLLKDIDDINFE